MSLFMEQFSWSHPFVRASTLVNNLFFNTVKVGKNDHIRNAIKTKIEGSPIQILKLVYPPSFQTHYKVWEALTIFGQTARARRSTSQNKPKEMKRILRSVPVEKRFFFYVT